MCTGIHCIWGDSGARVYLLKGFNRVKGQCDVIFSRSFIGGHLWWGWGKVDSGTDHTTNNTFTARWLCPNFWHSYLFHDAFLYPLIINNLIWKVIHMIPGFKLTVTLQSCWRRNKIWLSCQEPESLVKSLWRASFEDLGVLILSIHWYSGSSFTTSSSTKPWITTALWPNGTEQAEIERYSVTLIIQLPAGHKILAVLTRWLYKRGPLNRKMTVQTLVWATMKWS